MLPTYAIVTAIIRQNGKFLIAKRADTKRFSPGQWEFIAGFMDTRGSAQEIILKEIEEELKAEGTIVATAPAFEFHDTEGVWVTIPFLVNLTTEHIYPEPGEHSELKWVTAEELRSYEQLRPFLDDPGFKKLIYL